MQIITNFTAVVATIKNFGPGLELVGPTRYYGIFSHPAKLVLMFDMLVDWSFIRYCYSLHHQHGKIVKCKVIETPW